MLLTFTEWLSDSHNFYYLIDQTGSLSGAVVAVKVSRYLSYISSVFYSYTPKHIVRVKQWLLLSQKFRVPTETVFILAVSRYVWPQIQYILLSAMH